MQTKFLRHWSIIIALCFTCNFLHAQAINKVEYFFDTDPGIGNGTTINLSTPSLTVDSTFTFNVSPLSNGLHMLYVRSQDVLNKWSLNYSGSFIKTNGPDGPLSIVKLEYFIDSDPGYGNAIDISIQSGNIVNDTFDIAVPDNGADSRYVAVRALDSKGQWSLLYDYSVNMCDLYKAKPSFSWIRFADQFSFIDSSTLNPSHHLLWKFGNLGVDSVSNPVFTFPQGNYYATLVAGIGCRKDSITRPLFVGLENYYPDTALAGGNLIMSLFGGGMDTAVTVKLVNGSGSISPFVKKAYNSKELYAVFDFHTALSGVYNIQLHYPGGYDTTIVNGIRIADPPGGAALYEPDISIDIVGPSVARGGTQVKLQMVITNNGGLLAESIPVWLTIGENGLGSTNNYSLGINYIQPSVPFNYTDSMPTFHGLDSLLGRPWHGRVHDMIIPYLNAGESYVHTFYVTAPVNHDDYVDIYAWSSQRMHGSPLRGIWNNCFETAFDFVAGVFPPTACASAVFNYVAYDLPDFYHGRTNFLGSFGWSTLGTLIDCIPGGAIVEKMGHAEEIVKAVTLVQEGAGLHHDVFSATYSSFTDGCKDANDDDILVKRTHHRVSSDPNEISGPNGYGENNYINGKGNAGYHISFENLPTATANAQRVYIADTLDKTKLDLSSFSLISFAFGDTTFILPPKRKEFTQTIDLRPGIDLFVRFNVKLDTASGILRYSFLSLDPDTRDTLPLYDLRGFLPPNTDGTSGTGSVSYLVKLRSSLVTDDAINNRASIIFDNNAPILTNTWLNTIDKIAPAGGVTGGTLVNDSTVRLNLAGTDIGAGIHRYKVYVSINAGPFKLIGMTALDTVKFRGIIDSTYSFYAVPLDSVNNIPTVNPVAQYTVTLSHALPVTILSFDAQKQQKDVLCKWQTTDEMNLSEYIVERSTDGIRYEIAGTVTAQNSAGIKIYQFKDLNALTIYSQSKSLYYRLKMVDIDRTSKYSQVARIDMDKKYTVAIYPNPANKVLSIQSLQYYKQLQVIDVSGRIVMSEIIKPGMRSINIEQLTAGSYILKLSADDDVQSMKFIKD